MNITENPYDMRMCSEQGCATKCSHYRTHRYKGNECDGVCPNPKYRTAKCIKISQDIFEIEDEDLLI